MTDIAIRPEQPGDEAAIHDLVKRAFAGKPYADGDEQDVIDRLRADGDLLLSLVAERGGIIVGQITYSPAVLLNGDRDWVVLGPVAVDPAHQGGGVGRALIEAGEAAMRTRGAGGITVLGNPAIYSRFGFVAAAPMWLAGEIGKFLQVKSLGAPVPATEQRYVRAFDPA
ncbi:GNAT family N-acetyltransferase [Porphyrobacter sp. LM 6]|jgi:putative acetyltransferase|uniref:GNAT family N-acetyltransferase n=1 Tax=Porphyrobacter sp. LM 6 TaxID=1896196 RepID=UPI0008465FEB|nr:N-acetyltransferase [Porphyrobacter sp. LM 6]AOL93549.1 putative acetyltransferase [Porphyrobacter sp. LM 6]